MDNTEMMQMVSRVRLRTKNICIKSARFCSTNFLFEILFKQRHVLFLYSQKDVSQYQRQKIPALSCVKLISASSHPRWLLQRSSSVLDQFFRFLQVNVGSNSCMTLTKIWDKIHPYTTSHFFKIIFCQHSKNYSPTESLFLQTNNITVNVL